MKKRIIVDFDRYGDRIYKIQVKKFNLFWHTIILSSSENIAKEVFMRIQKPYELKIKEVG
jgi:hypothetical protein